MASNSGTPRGTWVDLDQNGDYVPINPEELDPGASVISSDSVGSSAGSTGDVAPKKRGRKPGSKNAPKEKNVDLKGVESLLLSIHTILATSTQIPELVLDKDEAHRVAEAIANVSRHYDMGASEKMVDWGNLFLVFGAVYGTRIWAYRLRTAKRAT